MSKKKKSKTVLGLQQEPLHPELKKCLVQGTFSTHMISHHFVHEIFYVPEMNAVYNKQLEFKKERYREAVREKNFSTALYLHEKPYRLLAFSQLHQLMSDSEYWEYLRSIWVDSENIWQNQTLWLHFLSSDRPQREKFMDDDEHEHLKSLPERVKIYRGYAVGKNIDGYSWTLSREKAEFFANRFYGLYEGRVAEMDIPKAEIFAYISSRGEDEVIVLPTRRK
jgi:hypothetical protein